MPVARVDERFTTQAAQAALAEAGVRGRGREAARDEVAAQLILQAWFDEPTAGTRRPVTLRLTPSRRSPRSPSACAARSPSTPAFVGIYSGGAWLAERLAAGDPRQPPGRLHRRLVLSRRLSPARA